jgi:hypothetical protein
MPDPGRIHRSSTTVMAFVMMVIGVLLIIRTIALGGGPTSTGILLGVGFVLVGAVRIYLQSRTS